MTIRRRVAIIGSGFGGSVMACRLAESGQFDVSVLERGRRFGRNDFPRRPNEVAEAFWDPAQGQFGQFEYRSFSRSSIDTLTASGLGGGSLIYSNVLYRIPADLFGGWPGGIDGPLLETYYQRALDVLEARPYPVGEPSWPYYAGTPKAQELARAVARIAGQRAGHPAMRLEWPPLAVQFGPEPGRELTNKSGAVQTACVMCGECNIGCNTHSKNTLDLNYLARAQHAGANVRAFTNVYGIREGSEGRYTLEVGDPRYSATQEEVFDLVVVCAGSLGSTQLVLDYRDHAKTRKPLSPCLGTRWSPNGDLLGFVRGTPLANLPSVGPVITGAIVVDAGGYADGTPWRAWIEDGGFPAVLAWFLLGRSDGWRTGVSGLGGLVDYLRGWFFNRVGTSNVGHDLRPLLMGQLQLTNVLMLLGMGRDTPTGTLRLNPRSENDRLDRIHLDWRPGEGELHFQRTRAAMARIAAALGGSFVENLTSGLLRRYVTVHPLGGLPMGNTPEEGAVNARTAEVFGCTGLYVVDGSIFPMAAGPNPSLTIAALAELYAERLCKGSVQ